MLIDVEPIRQLQRYKHAKRTGVHQRIDSMRPARTTTPRARFEDLGVQWPRDRPLPSQPQDQKHELHVHVRTMATFQPDRVMPTPPYHSASSSHWVVQCTGVGLVSLRTLAGIRAPSTASTPEGAHTPALPRSLGIATSSVPTTPAPHFLRPHNCATTCFRRRAIACAEF
ncbi:hypothetical protein BT67DRAFT_28621 [Trichocladium antarcticum]|uniref:Uncharacterized protein n=1 Tax=Trichocladium antarcticum TaxID=1450529 RepID=A0AAN6UW51_9PEZI|nr:hypothetical protein BT67DRAFT_28621 [Trichocladium antarcticum]